MNGSISDDEETPCNNEVQFEGSNERNEDLPAVSESESEGEVVEEEFEQLPRKQLFKTLDECGDETNNRAIEQQEDPNETFTYKSADKMFSRTWLTKKEMYNHGRTATPNIIGGREGPRGRAKQLNLMSRLLNCSSLNKC